jgi:predicted acylesterase/phospholipase RssA
MSWKNPYMAWIVAVGLLTCGSEAQARTAFVLSGGGSKGSFEVGVLKKLYEKGIEPDILIGTSVGAINAAKLAEGQRDSMDELYDIWMSLTNSKDMYLQEAWYVSTMEFLEDIKRRKSDDEALVDAITLPWRLQDAAEKLDKAQSLYNLKPIQSRLRYCLDPQKVKRSEKTLRFFAVNLSTSELALVDQGGMLRHKNNPSVAYSVDLRKAVIASASIPIIFPPQHFDGIGPMADGGLREMAPVEMAKELGADHIFVILASRPAGDKPYASIRNMASIAARITDILVNEILRNDVSIGLGSHDWMQMPFRLSTSATVLYPRVAIHDGMAVEPELIRINADYGWMVASDVLQGLPRPQTAKLLDSADKVARTLLENYLTERELKENRGDFASEAAWGRARYDAAVRGRKISQQAVQQRQQAGGEIPERLRPFLQGNALAPLKIAGASVPDLRGDLGDQAAKQLRHLGFDATQVLGTGPAGRVSDQDPRAGQWLTAGCRVTLKVAPGRARPRALPKSREWWVCIESGWILVRREPVAAARSMDHRCSWGSDMCLWSGWQDPRCLPAVGIITSQPRSDPGAGHRG